MCIEKLTDSLICCIELEREQEGLAVASITWDVVEMTPPCDNNVR